MSERFQKLLEQTAKEEFGGTPPRSVEMLVQRAASELRAAVLRNDPQCPPDALYYIEMISAGICTRLACEVLYRERTNSGSPDWEYGSGFGSVSHWSVHQNGKNGRKP